MRTEGVFQSHTDFTEISLILSLLMSPFSVLSVLSVCPYHSTDYTDSPDYLLLLDPLTPKGRKDHRRGYHPRYCAPNTRKPCKGERSFVHSALLLFGSIINGDYHPRLCSSQPFRLMFRTIRFYKTSSRGAIKRLHSINSIFHLLITILKFVI